MRITPIKDGNVKCKKCADGITLATYFVFMAAAQIDVPLCTKCATDICTIFDLKELQAVARGEVV